MSGNSDADRYPPTPREPKHSGWQLLKFPIALTLYSAPILARYLWQQLPGWYPSGADEVLLFAPLFWLGAGVVIHSDTILTCVNEEHGLVTIFGLPQSGRWAPESNPVEARNTFGPNQTPEADVARLEYESLLAEAQYRDTLLLRTTYFSLGAIGLFAGILSTGTSVKQQAATAMVASLVMLAFAIAANSYKDSRDALWDRIGRIENNVPRLEGNLTTFNTIRSMDLRLLNTVSLSSYTVGLTTFMTALAYAVYCYIILIQCSSAGAVACS